MPKLYNIEVEIHQEFVTSKGTAYRAKVLMRDYGLFINGFVIYMPNPEFPKWNVDPPLLPRAKSVVKKKYVTEFNKKMPLWQEIEEACIDAGKLEWQNNKDVVIDDISDEPVNLDNIPF